jgi:hypothetical protein
MFDLVTVVGSSELWPRLFGEVLRPEPLDIPMMESLRLVRLLSSLSLRGSCNHAHGHNFARLVLLILRRGAGAGSQCLADLASLLTERSYLMLPA